MPVESYSYQLEPKDQEAVIWRFMNLDKFRDLITSGELYFARGDQFPGDEREGLAPEEFLKRWGLSPFDLYDRRQLVSHIGFSAQMREWSYLSCWHLFKEETFAMWKEYGKEGVAVCSRYSLLRAALDLLPDSCHVGLVRYESGFMERANLLGYITNKRPKYAHEQEVRAFLWIPPGPEAEKRGDRYIDSEGNVHSRVLKPPNGVPIFQRRAVDLSKLITGLVITPWASDVLTNQISETVRSAGYKMSVVASELAAYRRFLPDPMQGI